MTAQKKFHDIPILLLGPGKRNLDYRKKVKEELVTKGYKKIIIMEFTDEDLSDITLDRKFRRLISHYQPVLIFAFFHTGARMDGVTFELGWLCRNYTAIELRNRLKILEQKNYDWSRTTPYIEDLFSQVNHMIIDETKQHRKASNRIDKCAVDYTLGDFA